MLYISLAREEQEVSNLVMNRKSTPYYCKATTHLNFFRRAFPVLHRVWQLVWRSENFNKLSSVRCLSC